MRVHGGASSAAVRGPKVRLRGLSEIATNPPRLILAEQLFDSADVQHGVFQVGLIPAQVSSAARTPCRKASRTMVESR